jgi:hypothetical protein
MRELFLWLFTSIEMNDEFKVRVGLYIKKEFLMYEHH